jgi:dihydrofolate reductase
MRKVVYGVGVSLDGYIASAEGSVDWLERATARANGEDFGMRKFFESIDTVLMGRKTYDIALKMGMSKSGYPKMKNYVFSTTLPSGVRDGVEFVSESPGNAIAELKRRPGKDIWLCGGGELARAALIENALDQVILGIAPVLIGRGRLMFPPEFPETELRLAECKEYKGGVVGLTYNVVKGSAGGSSTGKTKRRTAAKSRPVTVRARNG